MNQRRGKTYSAGAGDGFAGVPLRTLINFCDEAAADLAKAGEEDSAFRFEMLADHLRDGYKGGSLDYNSRILGL